MEYYNYLKSLHLIFVITWFAGLFYIVRLFVYQIEADAKPSPEREILQKQYKIMTYRLWYIITWPSAVLASIFAFWMLFFYRCRKDLDTDAVDACQAWLCFCTVCVPCKMPSDLSPITKRQSETLFEFYANVE